MLSCNPQNIRWQDLWCLAVGHDSILHVVAGAPVMTGHLPPGPCLLVEADPDRLHTLVAASEGWPHPLVWHQGTLAAQAGSELPWHVYSDGRLDGPLGVDIWNTFYQNASLLKEQTIEGLALAGLLSNWPLARDDDSDLHLWIRQGNPLDALNGAGEWLGRVQRVALLAPKASLVWADAVDAWLGERGFERQEGSGVVWERDLLATQRLKMHALRVERDQLATQLAQREQQLALLRGEIDELASILKHRGADPM
jgi:hypothetical protein